MMDIESSNFSWSFLSSLHHTKHTTTSTEPSEDDTSRSFEVCICFTCPYFSVNYLSYSEGFCDVHLLLLLTAM